MNKNSGSAFNEKPCIFYSVNGLRFQIRKKKFIFPFSQFFTTLTEQTLYAVEYKLQMIGLKWLLAAH